MSKNSNKAMVMKLNTYQQVIGYFYAHLNKLCPNEVADIDTAIQELIEIQEEDYVDLDNLAQNQSALRFAVKHTLGMFATRAAAQAMGILDDRGKNRDGLDPEYVEEDL